MRFKISEIFGRADFAKEVIFLMIYLFRNLFCVPIQAILHAAQQLAQEIIRRYPFGRATMSPKEIMKIEILGWSLGS